MLEPLPMKILKHLRARLTISPIEALANYGCLRLAAAIHELRKAGHAILTHHNVDQSGHRYARYELVI